MVPVTVPPLRAGGGALVPSILFSTSITSSRRRQRQSSMLSTREPSHFVKGSGNTVAEPPLAPVGPVGPVTLQSYPASSTAWPATGPGLSETSTAASYDSMGTTWVENPCFETCRESTAAAALANAPPPMALESPARDSGAGMLFRKER